MKVTIQIKVEQRIDVCSIDPSKIISVHNTYLFLKCLRSERAIQSGHHGGLFFPPQILILSKVQRREATQNTNAYCIVTTVLFLCHLEPVSRILGLSSSVSHRASGAYCQSVLNNFKKVTAALPTSPPKSRHTTTLNSTIREQELCSELVIGPKIGLGL